MAPVVPWVTTPIEQAVAEDPKIVSYRVFCKVVQDRLKKPPIHGQIAWKSFRLRLNLPALKGDSIRSLQHSPVVSGSRIPMSYLRDLTLDMLEVPANCLVIADTHIPAHDADFVRRAIAFGETVGVEHMVLAGDFLDMGRLSHWGTGPEGTHAPLQTELKIAQAIIVSALDKGWKLWWIAGNHEIRMFRLTLQELGMWTLAELVGDPKNLAVSELAAIKVKGWGKIIHPATRSKSPLNAVYELVDIHGCSLMSTHGHHWGQTWSKGGNYQVIEIGTTCDAKRIHYKQARITRHAQWQQGFAVIVPHAQTGEPWAWLLHPSMPLEALAKSYRDTVKDRAWTRPPRSTKVKHGTTTGE